MTHGYTPMHISIQTNVPSYVYTPLHADSVPVLKLGVVADPFECHILGTELSLEHLSHRERTGIRGTAVAVVLVLTTTCVIAREVSSV